jgi:hypothetical protein
MNLLKQRRRSLCAHVALLLSAVPFHGPCEKQKLKAEEPILTARDGEHNRNGQPNQRAGQQRSEFERRP